MKVMWLTYEVFVKVLDSVLGRPELSQCLYHPLGDPAQAVDWLVGKHKADIFIAIGAAPIDHRRGSDFACFEQAL